MLDTKSNSDNRREFLKKCGLATIPFFLPTAGRNARPDLNVSVKQAAQNKTPINFIFDGLSFSPQDYLEQLQEINDQKPIEADVYGHGGATKLLEAEFAKITGKEKAIYLPTGTMANQLAIKLLNGNNTKVIVPENSHIFRDEADAAQSVHNKRLIPVGQNQAYFQVIDLENTIQYLYLLINSTKKSS